MPHADDVWYWKKAVPLLSLDVIRPFFGEMGIGAPDAAVFQRLFRQCVVKARPSRASGVPNPSPEAWITDVTSRLRDLFGEAFVDQFRRWMFSVLFPPADLPYNAWRLILSDCSRTPESWQSLGFPATVAEPLRQRLLEVLDWTGLQGIAEEIRRQPLSEWDLALYALYDYYQEANDPIADAVAASKRRRLFAFWRDLEKATTAEERIRLLQGGQERAKQKGMSLTLSLLRLE